MQLEIVEACENSILNCFTNIIAIIYVIFMLTFSIYAMIKLKAALGRFSFEVLPLGTAVVQAVLQFYLNLINFDMRIIITAVYFQLLTFVIVTYSFCLLYYRISVRREQKQKRIKRLITILTISLVFSLGIGLFCSWFFDINCSDWMEWFYIIPWSGLIFISLLSSIYGYRLWKKLSLFERKQIMSQSNANIASGETGFYENRKNQIRTVVITIVVTCTLDIIMDIIRTNLLYNSIYCPDGAQNHLTHDTQTNVADVFMLFYTIIQITPTLLIPYAFYYVPFLRSKFHDEEIDNLEKSFLKHLTSNPEDDGFLVQSDSVQNISMIDPFLKKLTSKMANNGNSRDQSFETTSEENSKSSFKN